MVCRRLGPPLRILGTLLALPVMGGCAATGPAVGTFPGCPVPVLLSRVNRVGRKEPAPSHDAGLYAHRTAPNRLTWFVHDLVPANADVRASDIQLDELRVTTDFTVVGLPANNTAQPEGQQGPNNGPGDTFHAEANGSLQTIVQVRGHKVWVTP
jgi:hypothetical protein